MADTVDASDGVHQIIARAATTILAINLPKWCRRVTLHVIAAGSDVEWAWTGVDGAASFATAAKKNTIPAGSAANDLYVPQSKYQSGDTPVIYIRDTAATATTINVVCTDRVS